MSKIKVSSLWSLTKEELQEIANNSKSIAEILRNLSIRAAGGNYKHIKNILSQKEIDISHISLGINSNKGRKFESLKKIPTQSILKENSNYSRFNLKKRLIQENLLEYKCTECNLIDSWNNKKLSLQLDHINGIPDDNRLENLRFLCPNCHSQTESFAGKKRRKNNLKSHLKNENKCKNCGKIICNSAVHCFSCSKELKTKINWPSFQELKSMVENFNYSGTARKLGVSHNAVKKRIKKFENL